MNTSTKITLKSGYTNDYLPFGTYKNYTLLVAIANYSANEGVAQTCRFFLDEDVPAKDKLRKLSSEGGFVTKACVQDFAAAYKHADGSNRKALLEGLTNNEIEL